jgi:hypothetical protein
MATFMLLLRGGRESLGEYTPEQFQVMIQPYVDWSRKLREEGRLLHADELASGGKTIRANGSGFVIDGPYTETKEDIGGYFLIHAADEAEAIEIAKGCPNFSHGGFVELRQVNEH